jgi:hypothetical protein
MTNRIGGDFNHEAVEAFRAAYAQQLASPDEEAIANNSGLPTNTVSNTSPWIEHTGLWKYPSGKGPDQDLRTAFDPNAYLSGEMTEEEAEEGEEYAGDLTEEETEQFLDEIIQEVEEKEAQTEG